LTHRDPLKEYYYTNLVRPLVYSGLVVDEIDLSLNITYGPRESTAEAEIHDLTLVEGWRMDLYETARDDGSGNVEQLRYVYTVQDHSGLSVVRYDNAPHFNNFKHFPHHRHDGPEEAPAPNPDHRLQAFLQDVSVYMGNRKYLQKRRKR